MSDSGHRDRRSGGARRRQATTSYRRSSTVQSRPPSRQRPSRRPPSRRPPRRSRTARRLLGVALLLLILLVVTGIAVGGYAAYRQFTLGYVFAEPVRGGEVSVTIAEGASLKEIAATLEDNGVVASARAFRGFVEDQGKGTMLRPGTYTFVKYDNYGAIVALLEKGGDDGSIDVPLPEGLDAKRMATVAAETVEGFSRKEYIDLTLRQPVPFALPGKKSRGSLEGLLFPKTYAFPPLEDPRSLVDAQLEEFRAAFAKVDLKRAKKKNLTDYDVVIIASMIEREVLVAKERKLVSAVIWNRLALDMPLQIDATIEYAIGKRKKALTLDDLEVDSPYNTYRRKGLPPTPICNPGLAALKAAAAPADVDYIYYVVRNDGTGRHAFSDNYDQFLRDKEAAGL